MFFWFPCLSDRSLSNTARVDGQSAHALAQGWLLVAAVPGYAVGDSAM
jgi:hypothetical protein